MPRAYLIDMDGVLLHGKRPIPGASTFISHLRERQIPFLLLTNNPLLTPEDQSRRLTDAGFELTPDRIFTSAQATAHFLQVQRPNGSAFVIGENGLLQALAEVGYRAVETDPDYVILGETFHLNAERIGKAVRLVAGGARFVATNPDVSGPTEVGLVPACGAVAAMVQAATGVAPYFLGKPNPLMMREGLRRLGMHSSETAMIGDRMDTDILAGTETGLETILVLSGVTKREDLARFPYLPLHVFDSVADIPL